MNADITTDVWSITHREDIGAGQSVGDVTFYAYLCRVADWRLDWEKSRGGTNSQSDNESLDLLSYEVEEFYDVKENKNSDLIDTAVNYRLSGVLSIIVARASMPSLVISQTLMERGAGKSAHFGDDT